MTKRLYQLEKTFKTHANEFIRYVFTPAFGFVMLFGALCMLAIVTILLYRYQPLSALFIFCSSTGFFGLVMIVSLIRYVRYKKH